MRLVTYREAITLALADELDADPTTFLLGEDIAAAGGAFKATDGLLARLGARRVLDTPISEQAIMGTAIGAAARGLRPIAELMFADFTAVCFDQIVNQLAKYRYMTGGQISLPVTIRLATGASLGFGAQHSQSAENWFLNVPGLIIVVPSTPADAYGLLRSAIRNPNPVLFFEHKALYNRKGSLPENAASTPIGEAAIVHPGCDVTIVATQLMLARSLEAAELLGGDGIDPEVIDLRTLAPLDVRTVELSVRHTRRVLVVQEGPMAGGWAATLVADLASRGLDMFDSAPRILSSDPTPVPYAAALEAAWLPGVTEIVAAVRAMVEKATVKRVGQGSPQLRPAPALPSGPDEAGQ